MKFELTKLCGEENSSTEFRYALLNLSEFQLKNDFQSDTENANCTRWKRKKHGPEYRRQWLKLHIGLDAKTLQIRAIQLTTNNVSDSQVLGDLLAQIPQDEQIDSVYTDAAYDTKKCRQVIADRQAHAVIPPIAKF